MSQVYEAFPADLQINKHRLSHRES